MKHYAGYTMRREDMPEASAVYSMSHFKRAKDILFSRWLPCRQGQARRGALEVRFRRGRRARSPADL
jgi:hypothetical protein